MGADITPARFIADACRCGADDAKVLAEMAVWERDTATFGVVPEVRFRLSVCEVELWLHPEPGAHDDRLPPHGFGKGATLREAWHRASEELMTSLYAYAGEASS